MFGRKLGKNFELRRFVGIHTTMFRATEALVKGNGKYVSKLFLYTGMPDWPMSVACGMLGIPFFCPTLPLTLVGDLFGNQLLMVFAGLFSWMACPILEDGTCLSFF